MSLTIKAIEFQEMVARACKGSTHNKLLPLTSLMKVSVKDNVLSLVTTNTSDYLYIRKKVEAEDLYAVVQTEQFSKLISKMTCENITLSVDNNVLIVKGNGTYKVDLIMDETGELVKYPDPVKDVKFEGEASATLNLTTVKTILATNKAALATTLEVPVYTGYYVGDEVISTDSYKICCLKTKLFDTPVMVSPETMNLLDVMKEETITVDFAGDIMLFTTEDCVLYSHKMEGIEDFAIEPISNLINETFESSCKIDKNATIATLERISLFVGPYDNKSISLTFTDTGIDISSKKSTGVETVKYMEVNNFKPFTCNVDIMVLIQQLKANTAESIELQFGNEATLKIVEGNITQIIALLGQE